MHKIVAACGLLISAAILYSGHAIALSVRATRPGLSDEVAGNPMLIAFVLAGVAALMLLREFARSIPSHGDETSRRLRDERSEGRS